MLRCLSEGYDTNDVVLLSVDDRHRHIVQQSEGDKSLLIVAKPVVFVGCRQSSKDLMGIREVEAVFLEVQSALGFVPFEPHRRSVYTL